MFNSLFSKVLVVIEFFCFPLFLFSNLLNKQSPLVYKFVSSCWQLLLLQMLLLLLLLGLVFKPGLDDLFLFRHPRNFGCLIFQYRFKSVYMPFAQFQVDPLSNPIISVLVFFLYQFGAFTYVVDCFISLHITSRHKIVPDKLKCH